MSCATMMQETKQEQVLSWQARCRYCGLTVVHGARIGDHEVHVLHRHLHQCRPRLADELSGAMSSVRKHFFVEMIRV